MAAARRVFERDGYFGARVADITTEAGVAHGSFYTYFASRQDVFVAVLREVGEQFRVAVAVPPGEPRRGVLAALDRANRRYLEAYRANSVIWALAEQVATMDEEIHRIRLRGRIEHVERVAKTIRRWQEHGLADRDIDPRTTAGALVSMLSNFAYWWLAGGDSYDPETAAATLTAIWARAVGLAERPEAFRQAEPHPLRRPPPPDRLPPLPGTLLLVDIDVDYDAVMPETRKTFGDVSVWPSGDLVATVEIGRPPDNFFDVELITSLADAYAWLDEQPEFRAALLCSDGKHFCAGADFTGRSGRPGTGGARELYAAAARLFEVRTPVVAAVQGAAVGGGLGLACAADFRVASPQARFCANFARLGLHHGFALTVTLPAIVGEQRALDLLCTGRRVGGEEAAGIGLADRLAEPEGLRAAAQELAAEIAAGAPLAVRSIRETMRGTLADRARAAMDRELAEQDRLRQTADFAEGIRASAQRRPPRFEAR